MMFNPNFSSNETRNIKIFFFLIPLITFLDCKALISKQNLPIALERQWMLTSITGFTKEKLIKNKAQLDLTQYSGSKANLGCGDFLVEVLQVDADKIKFKTQDNSSKKCIDSDVLEYVFKNELGVVNSYKIEGHLLKLYRNHKIVMVFVATDWD